MLRRSLRAAWRACLGSLRRLPPVARAELDWYLRIEGRLCAVGGPSSRAWPLRAALDKNAVRAALERGTAYRIIDPERLSADDSRFLAQAGFSLPNVRANSGFFSGAHAQTPPDILRREHLDTAFQREALAAGAIGAVSPASGARLLSNRSFLAAPGHAIFYRFDDGAHALYLAVGREGMGYIKLYLYVPHLAAVILLGHPEWAWPGRWELDQFRAYLIVNWPVALGYLRFEGVRPACAVVDQAHFAHHLWNTLSGVQKLVAPELIACIDRVAVTAEPIGPLDRLFPELPADRIERLSDAQLVKRALQENLFLVRPGGTVVDEALAARVGRVAREAAAPGVVESAVEFARTRWPVLWATVRAGNRTWASQAAGIAAIAKRLGEDYPDLGVVIDGYALPHAGRPLTEQQARLVDEERAVAATIRSLVPESIDVRSVVGEVIFASIVYARSVDLYLAHHGSLQHKIAWLANVPGVVHSNKRVLERARDAKYELAAFTSRADGIAPTYLSPDVVSDVSGPTTLKARLRWEDPLSNYEFDEGRACDLLRSILRGLKRPERSVR